MKVSLLLNGTAYHATLATHSSLMAGDRRQCGLRFCFSCDALWLVRGALQPEKVGQNECDDWICMNVDLSHLSVVLVQKLKMNQHDPTVWQLNNYSFWFVGSITRQGQPECCSQTQSRRPSTWSEYEVTWGYKDVQILWIELFWLIFNSIPLLIPFAIWELLWSFSDPRHQQLVRCHWGVQAFGKGDFHQASWACWMTNTNRRSPSMVTMFPEVLTILTLY